MRLFDSKESGNDFLEYCAKEQGAGMKKAVAPLAAKKHDATKPNHTMQQHRNKLAIREIESTEGVRIKQQSVL